MKILAMHNSNKNKNKNIICQHYRNTLMHISSLPFTATVPILGESNTCHLPSISDGVGCELLAKTGGDNF